jgi:hypothetical protein
MRWRPTSAGSATTDAYPAVVCLSGMEDWNLVLRQPGATYTKPLTQLLRVNGTAERDDTFRIYLRGDINNPDIVLEPGEFRVFSCQPVAANMSNISGWSQSTAATNQNTVGRALQIDEIIDSNAGGSYDAGIYEADPFTAEITSGPNLRMRHALDCWPGDRLELKKDGSRTANDQLSFFLNSSEHSELVITQGPLTAAGRTFAGIDAIRTKYADGSHEGTGPTNTPDPFAVIDIEAKSANEDRSPFPLFTHSNPMAGSLRASGAGRTAAGSNNGTRGAPASYSAKVRACDSWEGIIQQPDNQRAFGGYSVKRDKGTERAILTEIPLVQPTSLAQYAHANFGVRDQQPLLSIGNSFASPLIDATKVLQDNGANWTEFDQTYLLNAALWDGFFLSSVAPWMKTDNTTAVLPDHPGYKVTNGGNTSTAPINQVKSIAQVIEGFVLDGTPLDNPRFSIERSGASDEAIIGALDDYRRSASVLLNQGAFNVNSTSLEAWKAFLGNAKQQALQGLASNSPDATDNARFLRAVTRQDSAPATGNAENASNWQGFANLSDAQIEKLAKTIIAENKERFTVSVRGEREKTNPPGARLFGGHDKSTTPYLGLAEFINRFLCPQTWANRCGALQAAIFRADADEAAGLSDRLYGGIGSLRLNAASLNTSETPWFRHPDNIEVGNGGRVHTALGAPGNLLQSDLLQSLGSALATRSDTFTLRCFGESVLPSGETGVAWMEVVVQRTPEFIDRADPAETGSSAAKPLGFGVPTTTDPTTNRNLSLLNHILGRRFKVTSMRWLKTDEI